MLARRWWLRPVVKGYIKSVWMEAKVSRSRLSPGHLERTKIASCSGVRAGSRPRSSRSAIVWRPARQQMPRRLSLHLPLWTRRLVSLAMSWLLLRDKLTQTQENWMTAETNWTKVSGVYRRSNWFPPNVDIASSCNLWLVFRPPEYCRPVGKILKCVFTSINIL